MIEAVRSGGDIAVVVCAHAFLEPEWTQFDRALAQAANGVYTYVREPTVGSDAAQLLGGTAERVFFFQ